TRQGVRMAAGVASLDVAERRLSHEGAQACFVGLVLEERNLLVGDCQLGPQTLEPLAHVDEPSLEDRLGHGTRSLRPGAADPMRNRARMGGWTSPARSLRPSTTSCARPCDGSAT